MNRYILIGSLLLTVGCSGSAPKPTSGGDEITCPNGSANPGATIRTVNCATVVQFDGSKLDATLDIPSLGAAGIKNVDKVLRDVSQAANDSQIQFTQTCELYNACNLTSADYRERLDQAQIQFRAIREKVALLEAAKGNPTVLRQAVAQLYMQTVPPTQVTQDSLALEFTIQTRSGSGNVRILRDGETIKTGDEVVFGVRTSQPAHVYVFQRKPTGSLDVLFPNPKLALSNYLAQNQLVRLPPAGQSFKVNAEDLGEEVVYVAASKEPLGDLTTALNHVNTGEHTGTEEVARVVTNLFTEGTPECANQVRGLEVAAQSACGSMTRGLSLAPATVDGFFRDGASVKGRAMPGDDVVLQTLRFVHVKQ